MDSFFAYTPATKLHIVPSAQRHGMPDIGLFCPENGLRNRLNIDFLSFSPDYPLGDTSHLVDYEHKPT